MAMDEARRAGKTAPAKVALAVLALGLGGVLMAAMIAIPARPLPLSEEFQGGSAERLIETSGVANPVTAVLLNFRAYDTLLELAVLILAVLGVRAAIPRVSAEAEDGRLENPLLTATVGIMVPVSIVVAGYLLWAGADQPGGAFQAGAVLSGAGILLLLTGRGRRIASSDRRSRFVMVVGVAVFVAVGGGVMLLGGRFLEYPKGLAKALILAIETAAMVSVAAVFVQLFAVVRGPATRRGQRSDVDSHEDRP